MLKHRFVSACYNISIQDLSSNGERSEIHSMSKAFKDSETVTIYFGDSIRKLLRKNLRKKNTFFVEYRIVDIEGDILTVVPNSRPKEDEMPYEVTALRISASDKHILPEGELDKMREFSKDEMVKYAESHDFNFKEFKEALKPFRKAGKKDD